jgi:hypothetical protein
MWAAEDLCMASRLDNPRPSPKFSNVCTWCAPTACTYAHSSIPSLLPQACSNTKIGAANLPFTIAWIAHALKSRPFSVNDNTYLGISNIWPGRGDAQVLVCVVVKCRSSSRPTAEPSNRAQCVSGAARRANDVQLGAVDCSAMRSSRSMGRFRGSLSGSQRT